MIQLAKPGWSLFKAVSKIQGIEVPMAMIKFYPKTEMAIALIKQSLSSKIVTEKTGISHATYFRLKRQLALKNERYFD